MAQDEEPGTNAPGKKTVRRVVKKTAPASERRRVTLGRPGSATPQRTPSRQQAKKQRADSPLAKRGNKAGSSQTAPQSRRSALTRATRSGAAGVSATSSRLAQRTRSATRDAADATIRHVKGIRLPVLAQPIAALLAGLVTGLLTVVVGWGFTHLFSWLRGTSTGGQTWGKITVALMLVLALIVGDQLLRRLGVRRSLLTSLTGLCGTLILILAVLPGLIAGPWIWLVVPAVQAISFIVMHQILALADEYAKE